MKRAADTSRAALASISDDLPARAADVLDALQRFRTHHRSDPTAYELLRWMQIENPTLDHNSVRPPPLPRPWGERIEQAPAVQDMLF